MNLFNGRPAETRPADAAASSLKADWVAFRTLGKERLAKARDIGRTLYEQKAKLGHGGWGAWLKANAPFSGERANEFMRVYERWDECKDCESFTDALAVLANPRAPADLDEPDDYYQKAAQEQGYDDERPRAGWVPPANGKPSRTSTTLRPGVTGRKDYHIDRDAECDPSKVSDVERTEWVETNVPPPAGPSFADQIAASPGWRALAELARVAAVGTRQLRVDLETLGRLYGPDAPDYALTRPILDGLDRVIRDCDERSAKETP